MKEVYLNFPHGFGTALGSDPPVAHPEADRTGQFNIVESGRRRPALDYNYMVVIRCDICPAIAGNNSTSLKDSLRHRGRAMAPDRDGDARRSMRRLPADPNRSARVAALSDGRTRPDETGAQMYISTK